MMRKCLIAATILALAACSPNASEAAPGSTQAAPSVHPVSGLAVVPLTVTSGDKVHAFRVELARTGQEQARGLMQFCADAAQWTTRAA